MAKLPTLKERRIKASVSLLAEHSVEKIEEAMDIMSLITTEEMVEALSGAPELEPNLVETRADLLVVMNRKGVPPEVLEPVRSWVESPTSALDWK